MKKIFVVLMFVCLIPSISQAAVYYAPRQQSDQYGNALANLFGALIEAENQRQQEAERQKQIQELLINIRSTLSKAARSEAASWANFSSENGAKQAYGRLSQLIQQSGHQYSENFYDGIAYIGFQYRENQNTPAIQYEYAFNTNVKECFVRVSIPDFNLQEQAFASYKEPNKPIAVLVGEYLGIVLSETATKNGGLEVLHLVSGGIADTAGLMVGDELIKVDSYDLAKENRDRVAAYFALRFQQRALVKGTVLRQGKQKVFSLQL